MIIRQNIHNQSLAIGLLLCKTDKSHDLFPKLDMLRDIGVRIARMADPSGHGGQLMNSLNITGDEVDLEDTLTRPDHRDEYERELAVMADVRAYFEIAYKVRIVDKFALHPLSYSCIESEGD